MFKTRCKDLIELRIKKVWKGDDEKDRPNQIVFHITRSYEVNGKVIADEIFNKEVILKKEDAQTSDIWEKVLPDRNLPHTMAARMERSITIHTKSVSNKG